MYLSGGKAIYPAQSGDDFFFLILQPAPHGPLQAVPRYLADGVLFDGKGSVGHEFYELIPVHSTSRPALLPAAFILNRTVDTALEIAQELGESVKPGPYLPSGHRLPETCKGSVDKERCLFVSISKSAVAPNPMVNDGLILGVDGLPGNLVMVEKGAMEELEAISLVAVTAGQELLTFLLATQGKFLDAQAAGWGRSERIQHRSKLIWNTVD